MFHCSLCIMAFNAKGLVPQPFRWCKPAGSLFLLLVLSCFVTIAMPGQRLDGETGRKGGIREGIVAHAAERGATKANEAEDKPDWVQLRRFLFTVLPWLVVSLLAIHYGHFLWIKKVGKLLLTLLATMTVIAFVASGAVGWALKIAGFQGLTSVGLLIAAGAILAWAVVSFRILKSKPPLLSAPGTGSPHVPVRQSRRPKLTFSGVGGMESAKEEIRRVVAVRQNARRNRRYGVVQNGILLHGPRGSGKTFLAEAAAGEFKLNFFYLSPTVLLDPWIGRTGANLRNAFAAAAAQRPVLLFIDEIDALGASRQSTSSDSGGARQEFNNQVLQLMQCIDQYRSTPGLILMAATNRLDGLDPALVREGRFDVKIRVDLPDQSAREKILQVQLSHRPCELLALKAVVAKTAGFSAAKLQALVERAAGNAVEDKRKIEERDLHAALARMGGQDRPWFQPVTWNDIVLEADVEQDLKDLINLLNGSPMAERWNIRPPTGTLLVGPPGTGKSLLARLVATQTRRSFYPVTAAEILGGHVGDSVKKLNAVFERAKENSPSIVFFDELDGLLPSTRQGFLNQHDIQLVEECLIQISTLLPENNVFLIGTSNHLDQIDPRVLRGGRFSEKIHIELPSKAIRHRLFLKCLDGIQTSTSLRMDELVTMSEGLSCADIQAVCETAKRFAYRRVADDRNGQPTLIKEDFERSIDRIRVDIQPLA